MATYHVQKLKERLLKLEELRDTIETNGEQIALTGAWSARFPSYNSVLKEIRKIEGRIAASNGASPVLEPTYTSKEASLLGE
jgi:hypothetical protein